MARVWEFLNGSIAIISESPGLVQRGSGQHGGISSGLINAMDLAKGLGNPGPMFLGEGPYLTLAHN